MLRSKLSRLSTLFVTRQPSKLSTNSDLRKAAISLSDEISIGQYDSLAISLKIMELESLLNNLMLNNFQALAVAHEKNDSDPNISFLLTIYRNFVSNFSCVDIESELAAQPEFIEKCQNDNSHPLHFQLLDLQIYISFKKNRALYELAVNDYLIQLSAALKNLKLPDSNSENIVLSITGSLANNKESVLMRFHEIVLHISAAVMHSPRNDSSKPFVDFFTQQQKLFDELRFAPQMKLRAFTI